MVSICYANNYSISDSFCQFNSISDDDNDTKSKWFWYALCQSKCDGFWDSVGIPECNSDVIIDLHDFS